MANENEKGTQFPLTNHVFLIFPFFLNQFSKVRTRSIQVATCVLLNVRVRLGILFSLPNIFLIHERVPI